MKTKNLFAGLLALILLICACALPSSAKEVNGNKKIEIIILDENVSVETKEKIEKYFATGEPIVDNNATTYGLTCSLLGHKLENSIVDVITHKASSTSPRCLKKTYAYSACTRCDYETSTIIGQEYIICCS